MRRYRVSWKVTLPRLRHKDAIRLVVNVVLTVAHRTPRFWQSNNAITAALLPVAWLYRFIVFIRRRCYHSGLLAQHQATVPVIVVGNITAGGAGKTPLVIALANYLQTNGITTGVLCGGYGGSARGGAPVWVSATSEAHVVGDEAVLIARQTGLPVVSSKDRAAGAQLLATRCDCVICDDGLQHYRLYRDFELLVIDADRRFGNGLMLPAGPLREPLSRQSTVDLVCYSGLNPPSPGYQLQAEALVNLRNQSRTTLASFGPRRIHAVAGIAYPDKFFHALRLHGFDVIEHALPDHYQFTGESLHFDEDLPIVMTEKDAVKCAHFASHNTWYLAVSAQPDKALLYHFDLLVGRLCERR